MGREMDRREVSERIYQKLLINKDRVVHLMPLQQTARMLGRGLLIKSYLGRDILRNTAMAREISWSLSLLYPIVVIFLAFSKFFMQFHCDSF